MTKGSDLFVEALENEGGDRMFGIPGEENLDVVESIRKSSIQLVRTRHEQAAASMAATYGRLTGKPRVCLAPGVAFLWSTFPSTIRRMNACSCRSFAACSPR